MFSFNRNARRTFSAVAFLAIAFWAGTARAQTTSFTYQGKLTDGGTPANGSYDLQFALWDSAAGGAQIGSTQTLPAVQVSGGIFTVTLDFGVNAFPGANRFLEIGVRVSGGGSFTTLAPRQQISSTPYAIRTLNAGAADALSSACVACVQDSQINQVSGSKVNGTIPVASVPAGSANYIQNTNTQQTGANFNIDGNGTLGGTLSGNVVNATTQYNLGGVRMLSTGGISNLFVGPGIGQATTGGQNSFFGQVAGSQNTTGCCNSFFGFLAGEQNTMGGFNSFFGNGAGSANTTSNRNSFFGNGAGANSTGGDNSFFGSAAGLANTTGSGNTFIGREAGNPFGTQVNFSTAIGAGAGVSTDHTIVLGTSSENVVVPGTLSKLTIAAPDGLEIKGPGPFLTLNDTSASNLAGYIQNANGDLAFIPQSFHLLNSSAMAIKNNSGNVGIGTSIPNHHLAVIGGPAWTQASWAGAMEFANASAMGWQADAAGWHFGIGQSTGGLYFFQSQSQLGMTSSPADYIMILTDQGLVGINTLSPDTALTVNGGADKPGGGPWGTFSDERLKTIRGPFTPGLKAVMQLQPVRYEYKRDNALRIKSDGEHIGFGAQAVEKVIPEAVTKNDKGYLLVNNDPIMWTMLNAIKEQQSQIEQQHALATEQQNEITTLRAANAALNARLRAVEKSLRKRGRSARRFR